MLSSKQDIYLYHLLQGSGNTVENGDRKIIKSQMIMEKGSEIPSSQQYTVIVITNCQQLWVTALSAQEEAVNS